MRSIVVSGPGGERRVKVSPEGAFITVYEGLVADEVSSITARDEQGSAHVARFE